MAPDVLSPEQRSWTNRVLGILKERPTAETTGGEDETEETAPKQYGGSDYQAYDKKKAPKAMRKALGKKPPRMLSLKAWDKMGESVADVGKKFSAKKITGLKNNLDQVGTNDKKYNEARGECMELLDAKENNPERERVGQLLTKLNKLERAIDLKLKQPGGALTQIDVDKKHKRLGALQKELFAWNDRRAQQNLPPSREALAMGDLLQSVHQDLIKDIDSKNLDLPLTKSDALTAEEKAEVKATWDNLRSGVVGPGSRIQVPKTPGGDIKKQGDADRFRVQMLSNFARMLESEVGRGLVRKLNQSPHTIEIKAGESPSMGWASNEDVAKSRPTGKPLTDAEAKQNRGVGTGGVLEMMLDQKDSDRAYTTRTGNIVSAPAFITMGHELIHGLHFTRGMDRTKVEKAAYKGGQWTDREEYQTIHKGKTSEQTLRTQYGLSAERWGHSDVDPTATTANALKGQLEAMDEIRTTGRDVIDQALTTQGFDPKILADRIKLDLYKAGKTNPIDGAKLLRLGWDPNQLTLAQVQGVLAGDIVCTLAALGWTAYELPNVTGADPNIKKVSDTKRHHARSPKGRRYTSLGGDAALLKITNVNGRAGINLPVGAATDWEGQLAALEGAERWIRRYAKASPSMKTRLTGKKKLIDKLEELAVALAQEKNQQTTVVNTVNEASTKAGKGLRAKKITAKVPEGVQIDVIMAKVGTVAEARKALAKDGTFGAFNAVTTDLMNAAAQQGKKDPASATICTQVRKEARRALEAVSQVQLKTESLVASVEALGPKVAGMRQDMLANVEQMLRSPYVDGPLRARGKKAVDDARAFYAPTPVPTTTS